MSDVIIFACDTAEKAQQATFFLQDQGYTVTSEGTTSLSWDAKTYGAGHYAEIVADHWLVIGKQ